MGESHEREKQYDVGILFDLDGTLCSKQVVWQELYRLIVLLLDSDVLHVKVFKEFYARRGIQIDHEYFNKHIHGRHNSDIVSTAE